MKPRHIDLEIDPNNPFKNCKLDRKKYADNLTSIIKAYDDGFVLAINNEWGAGKTTFVKMWQQLLVNDGYLTLYFNAWENDFESNALVAIISELKGLIKNNNDESYKKLLKKGAVLAKSILPKVLKAIVEKYVDTDEIVDIVEGVTDGAMEVFQEQIDEYTDKKEGLKEFKVSLSEFIKQSKEDKPVVFIIDELDRCRPDYAVDVLEKMKHFFSVPGIVFVLSIDKEQLGNAVRGVYGSDRINADEYLRRFIDLEYSIPAPDTKAFCKYLFDYFEYDKFLRSDKRMAISELRNDSDTLIVVSKVLFEKGGLNLRQQEKIYAYGRLILSMVNHNQYLYPGVYLMLIFLKTFHVAYYNKVKMTQLSHDELLDGFFEIVPKGISGQELNYFINIEASLLFFYNNYLPYEMKKNLVENNPNTNDIDLIFRSRIDQSTDKKNFSWALLNHTNNILRNEISLNYLIEKIDLVSEIYF